MFSKCHVLALETATDFAGVGIVYGTKDTEFIISSSREKAKEIMTLIDRALKDVNQKLKDMDLLAVGIGPGLYTGVRIGLSIMKGLSISSKKPLVGISTLDTIACNFLGRKEKVVTLLNAYGGEVYGAVYEVETGIKREGNYFVGHIEDFFKKTNPVKNKISNKARGIHRMASPRVIFAGTGVKIYRERIEKALGKKAVFSSQKNWIPHPTSLAKLAIERFKKGRLPHPDKILPLYLKKSEAERKWKRLYSQH